VKLTNHLHLVKNAWSYTSTLPCASWCGSQLKEGTGTSLPFTAVHVLSGGTEQRVKKVPERLVNKDSTAGRLEIRSSTVTRPTALLTQCYEKSVRSTDAT
jgi:hypothetical protein